MKTISYINQHLPILFTLQGDHALVGPVEKNNLKEIITLNPNIDCQLQNKIRYETFKSKRSWIEDTIKERASFSLVQFSFEELLTFNTCFTDVSYKLFLNSYYECVNKHTLKAFKGFSIKRNNKMPLEKNIDGIKDVLKRMNALVKATRKRRLSSIKPNEVLSLERVSSNDLLVATNRGLIKRYENSFTIMDATHRLTAYGLAVKFNLIPKTTKLYGFFWEHVI